MHAFIDSLQEVSVAAGTVPRSSIPAGLAKTAAAEVVELVDSTAPVPSVKLPTRGKRRTAVLTVLSAACLAVVLTVLATQTQEPSDGTVVSVSAAAAPTQTPEVIPSSMEGTSEAPQPEREAPLAAEVPTEGVGVEPDAPSLEVQLVASPADATVWQDGRALGSVPFTVVRPLGDEVQRFTLRASRHRAMTIEVTRATAEQIEVELEPQRVRRPIGSGSANAATAVTPPRAMVQEASMTTSGMTTMSLESLRGFDDL